MSQRNLFLILTLTRIQLQLQLQLLKIDIKRKQDSEVVQDWVSSIVGQKFVEEGLGNDVAEGPDIMMRASSDYLSPAVDKVVVLS
jgi:hypothetical protein